MLFLFAALAALLPALAVAQVNVLTYHNDNARTGQNLKETLLSPANVSPAAFGKLFTLPVDGKVDAQPLYASQVPIPGKGVRNVVFVATEHDSVYAFDADAGESLWHMSLLGPGESPSGNRGCGQVTPEIGITATPVIDRDAGPNGAIFVVAMSKDQSGQYFQRLHALDIVDGTDEPGSPVEIHASYPGSGPNSTGGVVHFDPKQYKARPGLLLLNGTIYIGWSSHCDISPYTAWITAYNESMLSQSNVLNMTPNGGFGSIWASGAGLASDAAGNIYFLLANGSFDSALDPNGFPVQRDFGNAFMKLSTAGGQLAVSDYFAVFNNAEENATDGDLGSGGALVLPDLTDANGQPRHLAIGAGKDGNIYVVDRDNVGKFNGARNNIYQELRAALAGGEYGMPAYFDGKLYYGGVGDTIKSYSFSQARLSPSPVSQSTHTFGYPGATPSISANGSLNGIVWAAENSTTAVLHAFDASNLGNELYNSNMAPSARDQFGIGNKFITPTIANGKVYVGTTSGVGVFGLLNCAYSIGSFSASFGPDGGSGTVNVNAPAGCTWSAGNDSGFVTITNGGSGSASGTVSYSVPGNSGGPRTAALIVAGQTVAISQAGGTQQACTISMAPSSITAPSTGIDSGTLQLTTSRPDCLWTIGYDHNFVTALPTSGMGNATLAYTVYPNFSTSPRRANIISGESQFAISQSGATDTSEQRFIELLYFDFFGRLPSPLEVQFQIVNGLQAGLSRANLVNNFFNSPEFNNGGRFIAGLYAGILGRDAEYSGWLFQRNALATGIVSQPGLVANFLNSAEFQQKNGNLTDAQLVTLLYQQILLRSPSQTEIDYQIDNAIKPSGRVQFATNLLNSQEFQTATGPRLTAFLLYACLLQREPSPSDLAFRASQIATGTPLQTLISDFINSPEFGTVLQ